MRIIIGDGVVEWVSLKSRIVFSSATTGIGLEKEGKIVSGVAYTDFNGRNVFVHQAHEVPLNRKYLWTLFDYPFNQLKVERVTGVIPSVHTKARRLTEHLGFKLEAVLKDAHPLGDLCFYVVRRCDVRWLNEDLYKTRIALAA